MMDDPDQVADRAARAIVKLADLDHGPGGEAMRAAIKRIVNAAILSVVPTPSDGLGK